MQQARRGTGVPQDELDPIFGSDLPDLEKVRQAFDRITGFIIRAAQNEVELARAMQDRELVIKTQIKMSTMSSAREVFDTCYRRVTGRKAWDD